MRLPRLVVACVVVAACAAPAAAQWINQPTPGIPRTKDGKQLHHPGRGGSLRFVPDATGVASQMIMTIVEGDFAAMRKP